MTKVLRVHFEFTLEADQFGLHEMPPEVRTWITEGMLSAKTLPGVTVTVDPVEDAKGLRKVAGRPRGSGRKKVENEPVRFTPNPQPYRDAEAALSVVPDVA